MADQRLEEIRERVERSHRPDGSIVWLLSLVDALTKRAEAAEGALDAALACIGPSSPKQEVYLNDKMGEWQQSKIAHEKVVKDAN